MLTCLCYNSRIILYFRQLGYVPRCNWKLSSLSTEWRCLRTKYPSQNKKTSSSYGDYATDLDNSAPFILILHRPPYELISSRWRFITGILSTMDQLFPQRGVAKHAPTRGNARQWCSYSVEQGDAVIGALLCGGHVSLTLQPSANHIARRRTRKPRSWPIIYGPIFLFVIAKRNASWAVDH